MNINVYLHTLASYRRSPGYWFGLTTELIRALVFRVYVVILFADFAASLAVGDTDSAKDAAIMYFVATVSVSLLDALGDLAAHWSENMTYARNSQLFYQRLINKDMRFYRSSRAGYLAATLNQYIDGVILLARFIRGDGVRTAVSLTIPVIVLFINSIWLGFTALAIVVVQIVYILWANKKATPWRQKTHELYRQKTGSVADDVTNIVAFKSSGHQTSSLKRAFKLFKEEGDAFWQRRRTVVLLNLPRRIFTLGLISLALWIVASSGLATGELVGLAVLTLTYMFQIQRNLDDLPDYFERLDDIVTKIKPTLEILKTTNEEITDKPNALKTGPLRGAIKFNNVSFSYKDHDTKTKVFDNLSLSIDANEHVGIVGISGAGKSTMTNLLMRFDDVDSGSITIDGHDLRDYQQEALRKQIAYVPQEPLLFHTPIKDNIRYHNLKSSKKELLSAAKVAHAHDFITKLPGGYDTIVGERGVKLSGGQKQRIVIARAILKHAPIMIFDEATSALDSESEQIIQKALPEIIGRQTALIIAHRLSTVAGLDRIIVLDNGKIIEEGTHKELLDHKGKYFSLWQKQTKQT